VSALNVAGRNAHGIVSTCRLTAQGIDEAHQLLDPPRNGQFAQGTAPHFAEIVRMVLATGSRAAKITEMRWDQLILL
jgi:hypothetical protein